MSTNAQGVPLPEQVSAGLEELRQIGRAPVARLVEHLYRRLNQMDEFEERLRWVEGQMNGRIEHAVNLDRKVYDLASDSRLLAARCTATERAAQVLDARFGRLEAGVRAASRAPWPYPHEHEADEPRPLVQMGQLTEAGRRYNIRERVGFVTDESVPF